MSTTRPLPADVHRCPGFFSGAEGWRDGCSDCQRRTTPPIDHPQLWRMTPPPVIAFECPSYIRPGEKADIGIGISNGLRTDGKDLDMNQHAMFIRASLHRSNLSDSFWDASELLSGDDLMLYLKGA